MQYKYGPGATEWQKKFWQGVDKLGDGVFAQLVPQQAGEGTERTEKNLIDSCDNQRYPRELFTSQRRGVFS
jgi:hypothetical protein